MQAIGPKERVSSQEELGMSPAALKTRGQLGGGQRLQLPTGQQGRGTLTGTPHFSLTNY